MCGRFSMSVAEVQKVLDRFSLEESTIKLTPRQNISPSQMVPVVFNESPKILSEAKWGLIPSWAKDEKTGYKMINARADTVAMKPAYRSSFANKRCLIVADGFYDWKGKPGSKVPFKITLKDEGLFAFAGIWDKWKDTVTCSIITTDANELVGKIHDRMPVILERKDEKRWLSDVPVSDALGMLRQYDSNKMKAEKIEKVPAE